MKRGKVQRMASAVSGTAAMLTLLLAGPAALAGAPGDYNDDGAVDDADKQIIMDARNTTDGDAGFVPAADHDGDGVISLVDVSAFSKIYNAQNP